MTTTIEFTDRYGGRHVNWLTACHDQCEAMGVVPVFVEPATRRPDAAYPGDSEADLRLLKLWQEAEAASPSDDGWHFVTCPTCHGSRKVGLLKAVSRVPRWLLKGAHFIRTAWSYPGPVKGQTRIKLAWMLVKIAYLYDLGWPYDIGKPRR